MTSDTPRTDHHMELREAFEGCDPDFARLLETQLAEAKTELQEMTTLADRLAKQLQVWVNASGNRFVRSDVEALAAYEAHKKQTP